MKIKAIFKQFLINVWLRLFEPVIRKVLVLFSAIDVLILADFNHSGALSYFFTLMEFISREKYSHVVLIYKDQFSDVVKNRLDEMQIRYVVINHPIPRIVIGEFQVRILHRMTKDVLRYALKYRPTQLLISGIDLPSTYGTLALPYRIIYKLLTNPIFIYLNYESRLFINKAVNAQKILVSTNFYSKGYVMKEWFIKSEEFITVFSSSSRDVSGNYRYFLTNGEKEIINVLSIATLTKWKNPDVWLEIAKEVLKENNQIRFIWVGKESEPNVLNEYRKKAAKISADRIEFTGAIEDLAPYLRETDILLHTSESDNTSYSCIEAMSMGIPVICSNSNSMREQIVNGKEGYSINMGEPVNVAKKIIELGNNKTLRKELGKNARLGFEDRFSNETFVRNMKRVLQKKSS